MAAEAWVGIGMLLFAGIFYLAMDHWLALRRQKRKRERNH